MKLVLGLLATAAIVVVVIALTALAIRSMMRDRKPGTSGALSSAMLELHSLLEPEKRHIVDSVRNEREDSDEDPGADPPLR